MSHRVSGGSSMRQNLTKGKEDTLVKAGPTRGARQGIRAELVRGGLGTLVLVLASFAVGVSDVVASTYVRNTTTVGTYLELDITTTNPVGTYTVADGYGNATDVLAWNKSGSGCTGGTCTIADPFLITKPAQGTGEYWGAVYISSTDTVYYGLWVWDTAWGAYVPDDGITSTPSPTATTYTQNPVTFSGTYNNGQSNAYNQILFDVTNTTQGFEMAITKPTTMQSIEGATYSFDQNLPAVGNYTYQVRLWDSVNATGTPWVTGTGFGLGTTTIRTATSTNAFNDPTPESCDTLDIGCYIKVAIAWAFWPSQDSVDQFQSLTLANSAPFQYAYDIGNVRNELLTASATSTLTVSVPFGSFGNITLLSASLLQAVPFSGTIRTLLGYLLWFLFAELVYYQILRSHNKNV